MKRIPLLAIMFLSGCEALLPGQQSGKPPSPTPTPAPQVVRIEVSGSGAVNVGGGAAIDVKQTAAAAVCPCGCSLPDCTCGKTARVAAPRVDARPIINMVSDFPPGQCEPCDRAEADLSRIGDALPYRVIKTASRPAGLPGQSPMFWWTDSRGVIRYRVGFSNFADLTYSWERAR